MITELPELAIEKFAVYKDKDLLGRCNTEQAALNLIDKDIKTSRRRRDKYGWRGWESGVDPQAVYEIRIVFVEKYKKKYHGEKKI